MFILLFDTQIACINSVTVKGFKLFTRYPSRNTFGYVHLFRRKIIAKCKSKRLIEEFMHVCLAVVTNEWYYVENPEKVYPNIHR